jgi:uncharacterized membrane protein YidH (DUF202 family)
MLAFLVFGMLLLIAMGLLHFVWNKLRIKKQEEDAQSKWISLMLCLIACLYD